MAIDEAFRTDDAGRFLWSISEALDEGWACHWFHKAVRDSKLNLVRRIVGSQLSQLVNCHAPDSSDVSPLRLAIDNNNLEMVKVLFQSPHRPQLGGRGQRLSSVAYSCSKKGGAPIVRFLLEADPQHFECFSCWDAAMFDAIGKAQEVDTVQLLLDGVKSWKKPERSFLQEAVLHNHVPIAKLLIERKVVQVDELDHHNNTALHMAVAKPGQIDMVILLLEKGADPRVRNMYCQTAEDVTRSDYVSNLAFARKSILEREAKMAREAQERDALAKQAAEDNERLTKEQAKRDAARRHAADVQRRLDMKRNATSEALQAFQRSVAKQNLQADAHEPVSSVRQPTSRPRVVARRALQATALLVGTAGAVVIHDWVVKRSDARRSGKRPRLVKTWPLTSTAVASAAAITLAISTKVISTHRPVPDSRHVPTISSSPAPPSGASAVVAGLSGLATMLICI
ncbi:Ankyrin repeat domain-containing protein [Plasmodiophora brassicae]